MMPEPNKVRALGLFVGTSECNAHCPHCAGAPLRKSAPVEDGDDKLFLMAKTIRTCWDRGARSLTLTSSGEPTLSPVSITMVLMLLDRMRIKFPKISLYTNGIRIGEDESFARIHLAAWANLGLTDIHMTVHSTDEKKNAKAYGVKSYPSLELIVQRIKAAGITVRANVVLTKKNTWSIDRLLGTFGDLEYYGVDKIACWPIRNPLTDEVDVELAPTPKKLLEMQEAAVEMMVAVHSRAVCGDEYSDFEVRFTGNKNFEIAIYDESRHTEQYGQGEKLTLFPDGTLANTWCK